MKTIKLLTVLACTLAWMGVSAHAESCCEKAKKAGKECDHKCCQEAAKDQRLLRWLRRTAPRVRRLGSRTPAPGNGRGGSPPSPLRSHRFEDPSPPARHLVEGGAVGRLQRHVDE